MENENLQYNDKSTLVYVAEIWRMKEHIKKKIKSTEMHALRRANKI